MTNTMQEPTRRRWLRQATAVALGAAGAPRVFILGGAATASLAAPATATASTTAAASAPATAYATAYAPEPAQARSTDPATACMFSAATLRRGAPVDAADDADCRSPSGGTAVFQGASLAKPVVASLALGLVLRGRLDLDQPLDELLPHGYRHRQNLFALRAAPVVDDVPRELLRKLTCRALLSHTSGLPNWSFDGPLRPSVEPGTRWQYSGEGYLLLQRVIETLTGRSLQDVAAAELFEPLGLEHSALRITDRIAPFLVPGHAASGAVRGLRFPVEIAAGSLYTTAGDYARFIASVLADERLLALVTQAPVPVPGASDVFWGLGWGIERASGRSRLWQWGNNPGFRALAMADLETRDAAVVLAASEAGMPAAKSRIRAALPGPHPSLDLGFVN